MQAGSRIVRNRDGAIIQFPSAISDPSRKIGLGYGARTYAHIDGLQRAATRDIAMGSLRDAFIDLAKPTVALMLATAKEING
jgi:hypothetical protein